MKRPRTLKTMHWISIRSAIAVAVFFQEALAHAAVKAQYQSHGSFRNFEPERAKNIKGRVLILHGAEDEVAPLTEVHKLISDLRAAKVS